jgi:RNA polymerase sigma-70 factor (ECF subfamily)
MEKELILRAKAGDREAFSRLTRTYLHRAHRAAYRYLGNTEDAADICQELFLRVYRHLAGFDAERPFYPWLYRILRNLCLNQMQRGARTVPLNETEAASSLPAPEGQLLRREALRGLNAALDSLPARDREILLLKHFDGLTYAEIAGLLDIPMGTVMSRLYAARRRLRGELEAREEGRPARPPVPGNQPKTRRKT